MKGSVLLAGFGFPVSTDSPKIRKTFRSEKAFEQHERSKKHKDRVAELKPNEGAKSEPLQQEGEFMVSGSIIVSIFRLVLPFLTHDRSPSLRRSSRSRCRNGCNPPRIGLWNFVFFATKNAQISKSEFYYVLSCLTLGRCMEHMVSSHGFFVPDVEYLKDVRGMMHYLKEKICVGYVCLWCNGSGRTFHSLEATQNHMVSNESISKEFYSFLPTAR